MKKSKEAIRMKEKRKMKKSTKIDPDAVNNHNESDTDIVDEPTSGSLSHVPLCDLIALRGSINQKLFHRAVFGANDDGEPSSSTKAKMEPKLKREHKRRPRVESSRQKPRDVPKPLFDDAKSKEYRDPRFDDRCGEMDEYIYEHNYSFMNDLRNEQKKILKKAVKQIDDKEKRKEIKATVKKIEDQERSDKQKKERKDQLKKLRKMNEQRMLQAELKKMSLEEKYAKLDKEGKLDSYLKRKQKRTDKKLKGKERRPNQRREFAEMDD